MRSRIVTVNGTDLPEQSWLDRLLGRHALYTRESLDRWAGLVYDEEGDCLLDGYADDPESDAGREWRRREARARGEAEGQRLGATRAAIERARRRSGYFDLFDRERRERERKLPADPVTGTVERKRGGTARYTAMLAPGEMVIPAGVGHHELINGEPPKTVCVACRGTGQASCMVCGGTGEVFEPGWEYVLVNGGKVWYETGDHW